MQEQFEFTQPAGIEPTATTEPHPVPLDFKYLVLLANDGTDDISFTFSDGATWTLKPGDKVCDVRLNVGNVTVAAKSGTQPYRAWGLV